MTIWLRRVLFYRAAILGNMLGSIPLASCVTSLNLLTVSGAATAGCGTVTLFSAVINCGVSATGCGYSLDHCRSVDGCVRADQCGCKFASGGFTNAVRSYEGSLSSSRFRRFRLCRWRQASSVSTAARDTEIAFPDSEPATAPFQGLSPSNLAWPNMDSPDWLRAATISISPREIFQMP